MSKYKYLTVVLLFVSLAWSNASWAQWSVGPKIGYNFSKYTTTKDGDTPLRITKPGFGVAACYNLNFYFWLQAELLYNQRGGYSESPQDSSTELNLSYFDMPIMLKGGYGIRQLKGHMYIGLYPGVSVYGKDKFHYNGNYSFREHLFDDKDNRFDFGWLAGADVEMGYGYGMLFTLDLRYNRGLTQVTNERYKPMDNFWSLSFGVRWYIGNQRFI